MKQFKLKIHSDDFSDQLLVFNASEFPDVMLNDILKINHCNNNSSNFILVQVKSLKGEINKDTISIKKRLATCFNFQVFQDVNVVKVEPEDVTVDLLEVSFKDQYISRSDMLRMKKHLLNSCVYIDHPVEFSDIRAQVSEMWANSVKVKCGFISDHTNFVLRSFTAKVYLFIQMSAEMWEYDPYGYLQFERAVNGFLKALFTKWKEKKCCHELTLVLFSRTFYETKNLNDFPPDVREVVRKNYNGQYYLDFYKCVVQTERMDDCTPLVKVLKKLFHKYQSFTEIPGCPPGKNSIASEGNFLEAINMSLNVFDRHYVDRNLDRTGQIVVCITPGVGVFDVDRDLTILTKERMIDNGIGSDLICLGQQPLHAVPLFKFHHSSATNDLMHEPSKPNTTVPVQDFNIPHWINHSFYAINPFSDKGTTNINYIPRIHVAKKKQKKTERKLSTSFVAKPNRVGKESSESDLPTLTQTNYAEFDKQVFGFPRLYDTWKHLGSDNQKPAVGRETISKHPTKFNDEWPASAKQKSFEMRYSPDTVNLSSNVRTSRPVFIPLAKNNRLAHVQQNQGLASSVGMTANLEKYYRAEQNLSAETQPVVGSANVSQNLWKDPSTKATHRRALFNPFNPSHMFAPLTANRRRWVHTYPRGPQGEALVLHHQNPLTRSISRSRHTSESADDESTVASGGFSPSRHSPATSASFHRNIAMKPGSLDSGSVSPISSHSPARNIKHLPGSESISWSLNPNPAEQGPKGSRVSRPIASYGLSWMWGIAGDIQWTSDTHTGLDWKSLKCPACLPITTDYHPTYSHLRNACTEQSYFLVPDDGDSCADNDEGDVPKPKTDTPGLEIRTSKEVFQELINQRLCQGFQIIKQTNRLRANDSTSSVTTVISPNNSEVSFIGQMCGTSPMYSSPRGYDELKPSPHSCMLSHGRQYHFVRFVQDDDKIEVIIFKPRHPFDTVTVEYGYMLWPKTRGQFQPSRCSFAHEKVEGYPWNHHDNYVCCVDSELQMTTGLKCWKAKFAVLPNPTKRLQVLKRCPETGDVRYDAFNGCHCDKSHESNVEGGECGVMTEGFIRFLEHINKIKRPNSQAARKSWKSFANFSPSLSKSYTSLSALAQGGGVSTQATPTPPARPTSGTPTSDRSTPIGQQLNESFSSTPISTITTKLSHAVDARPVAVKTLTDKSGDHRHQEEMRRHSLTSNSELTDILAALSHPETGLCFLAESYGFPSKTFVSLEAVHWALANVGGLDSIKEACRLFETMCNYTLISHASGDKSKGFVYGCVFYSVNDEQQTNDIEDPTSYQYMSTLPNGDYNSRWFEVAIKRGELTKAPAGSKGILGDRGNSSDGKSGAFYVTQNRDSPRANHSFPEKQTVRIPLVNKMRTNRTEWTEVRYSTGVWAGADSFIFSFEMQWMVATASCISNLLQLWFRKATSNCDLYLFPVPSDPFSFPRYGAGGPLRSPLFVPLKVKVLLDVANFKELSKNVAWYRDAMISFMEAILHRFGFIRDDTDLPQHPDPSAAHTVSQNYIHCTGQAFAQIPLHNRVVQRHSISLRQRPQAARRSPLGADVGQANRHGFVAQSELDSTGFYWSTNYMQTKRWRLSVLDDFPAQDIEQDFVRFCANSEDRLRDFFSCFMAEYVATN